MSEVMGNLNRKSLPSRWAASVILRLIRLERIEAEKDHYQKDHHATRLPELIWKPQQLVDGHSKGSFGMIERDVYSCSRAILHQVILHRVIVHQLLSTTFNPVSSNRNDVKRKFEFFFSLILLDQGAVKI